MVCFWTISCKDKSPFFFYTQPWSCTAWFLLLLFFRYCGLFFIFATPKTMTIVKFTQCSNYENACSNEHVPKTIQKSSKNHPKTDTNSQWNQILASFSTHIHKYACKRIEHTTRAASARGPTKSNIYKTWVLLSANFMQKQKITNLLIVIKRCHIDTYNDVTYHIHMRL